MTEVANPADAHRSLGPYQAKRDFERTPEPAGAEADAGAAAGRFVVQRHRARRLHYDLRLELDGVLVSWAVPKGPTLDPSARHLAVHVEDHPIEYRDFEGVIPPGEYGGGDVIVWDEGTWQPPPGTDPHQGLEEGNLHFDLFGHKLAGRFVLVRPQRRGRRGGKEQWLLLHKRDDAAIEGWDPEDHPHSVKSGRTNDEVAEAPDAMWDPDRPAAEAEVALAGTADPAVGDPAALAALDALGEGGRWAVDGHALRLGNLDAVVVPAGDAQPAVTKRDLVRYVVGAGPRLLTYLRSRPAELRRFPGGLGHGATWQRTAPAQAPAWLSPGSGSGRALVLENIAALAWAANRSALELHTTTTTAGEAGPGWAWLDLEPGRDSPPGAVVELARLCRAALDHLGLEGRVRTVGASGLQLWVPASRGQRVEETRTWVEALARTIATTSPELAVAGRRPRGGQALVRLHGEQNADGARLLVPYSPQALPGAPVSVPLTWEELGDSVAADRWTIATVPARLARQGDPLEPLVGLQQHLPALA